MPIRKMQTNFSAGEIVPGADQRTDLSFIQNGVALMRDCKPLAQGGVRRRGGLQFCADLPGQPYQHYGYVFNAEQTYQILFRHHAFDVYDGVTGTAVNFNIGGAWEDYMIGQLSVHSWNDKIFVAHPNLPPQEITRLSAVDFMVQPFRFATDASGVSTTVFQPYHSFARPDVYLLVEAQSGYTDAMGWVYGSVALVGTPVAYFTPSHVGCVLAVGDGQFQIIEYVNPQAVRATVISPHVRLSLLPDALTIVAGTTLVEVYQPFNNIPVGNQVMILNAQAFGLADYDKINGLHAVTASNGAIWYYNYTPTGPVLSSASIGGGPNIKIWTSHFGTLDWKEQMYSSARGWPHCVSSYQSRLVFGGGIPTPNRLNLSQVESPYNFDVGTGQDDESIQIGLSGQRTPIIRQVVGAQHLQIFTSEGEYFIPRLDNTAALTPKTASVVPQSQYGIKTGIPAIEFDGSTVFISKNAANLRQMVFGANDDQYSSPNLAFLATHLIQAPASMTVQMEDDRYAEATVYIVNIDAERSLAAFTMVRSEKIAAWARWNSGAGFYNACSVNGSMFFIVRRMIAGSERCHLLKLNHDRVLDGSIMGGFAGKSGQHWIWNGFSLYAGQPISLVVDGWSDIGLHTPDGLGQVAINVPATTLEGGFGFAPHLRTLPPEMALPSGPSHGQMRRVVSASIDFENSLGVVVRNSAGGRQTGQTKLLNTRAQDDLGLHAPVLNGKRDIWLLGWDDKGWVDISQTSNAPMVIKSINLDLEW